VWQVVRFVKSAFATASLTAFRISDLSMSLGHSYDSLQEIHIRLNTLFLKTTPICLTVRPTTDTKLYVGIHPCTLSVQLTVTGE